MSDLVLGPPRRSSLPAYIAVSLCLVFISSRTLMAADLDIPRIEADARRGSVKQEIQLGGAYLSGRGVPQNLERAAYWYERAANAGDALAQNEIGYFYQIGLGVQRDPVRAAQWYQRAADGGYACAKVNLGIVYLWGIGVKKDETLASELMREAAAKNCGVADAYLGDMNYFGLGTQVDRAAAQEWYTRGAKLKNPLAEMRLGAMLTEGNASRHDLAKAAELLRESAAEGYVPAQHCLGLLLTNHPELPSRPNEALDSLQSASEAGRWQSSVAVGVLYRDGRGVAKDDAKAYYYFRIAQLQGRGKAEHLIDGEATKLSHALSSEQVESLNAKADTWMKIHPLTLQFVYKDTVNSKDFPAFALSAANDETHAGRLIPTPSNQAEP